MKNVNRKNKEEFSDINKINNFQQQKQHMLILSNKTPKVLLCWIMLLRGSSECLGSSKTEKLRFFDHSEKSKNEQFFDNFWNLHSDGMCAHIDTNYVILQIGNILVGGFCGNKSATNVASPLSRKSVFICGADFFQVLIKSTLFGNKNNYCCF